MLLEARYEDNGEAMHEDQVIDEILIVLIAGHETTANALSWTLYLLGAHPEEREKLRDTTGQLNITDIIMHDGLNAVIKESMRLYPPAWISDRVSLNDDAYKSFSFPKGIIIIVFYYGLHRDEKFWPNPNAFVPSRFEKNNIDKERLKAYFPFGAGPRLCIGNNFAMAEMLIFLQAFIQRFEFKYHGQPPTINPLVTLRPDKVLLEVEQL